MRNACHGFTFIELLVVLAIAALLLALAVPAFAALVRQGHFAALTGELIGNLNYARSEAIRRNQAVYACALNAKTNLTIQGCSHTKKQQTFIWDEGILLFADQPNGKPNQYDSNERVRHALFRSQISVRSNTSQLAFDAEGHLRNNTGNAFILRDRLSGECRTIWLNASGRAHSCQQGESDCDRC
jgi:type IV fimbrial biogenesis protein FimT